MEVDKIKEALRRTVDPSQTQDANAYLESVPQTRLKVPLTCARALTGQVQKIIGFAPMLLQVVMDEGVEIAVRQAGVIYLKVHPLQCQLLS